jgi:hypothetical protein
MSATETAATTAAPAAGTTAIVTFADDPDRTFPIPIGLTLGDDWRQKTKDAISGAVPAAADADLTKSETGGQTIVTVTKKAGKKGA